MAQAATQPVGVTPFELLHSAQQIIRQEAEALEVLARRIPSSFSRAVGLICNCRGSVIVTGIGKAGWIAQKISASLASTGTRSHYLHPSEAVHGDLGRIAKEDVILALSNSGETEELLQLLPTLQSMGLKIIAMTASDNNSLARQSHLVLDYGSFSEACPNGLAPSTSTTVMLALGDALALVAVMVRDFKPTDFAKFHPGGSLGQKLSTVDEIMRPLEHCRVSPDDKTVREIYVHLHAPRRRSGAILLTGPRGELTGLFTDSDLARLLERQQDKLLDQPIANVMTKQPFTVCSGSTTLTAVDLLACQNISELPVVDSMGRPCGIVDITDVVGLLPRDKQ